MKMHFLFARRIYFLLALITFFHVSVTAQTDLLKARELKANYKYAKAIKLYKDYFNSYSPGIIEAREMAECYIMTDDTKSAEEWMTKVISFNNHNSADILTYAQVLKSNGKYKEAIKQYEDYAAIEPNAKNYVSEWILSCRKSMEQITGDSTYNVKNVTLLNSEYSEFGLIPFENGYIFSSDRYQDDNTKNKISEWTGNAYMKLFFIQGSVDNPTSRPVPIDALNFNYHNGQGVYDSTSKTIYYTSVNTAKAIKTSFNIDPTSWSDSSSTNNEYVNRLEIYSSCFENGSWNNPKAFVYNNSQYSVGHPALSPDGKILYFSSDMPGGYGCSDIYYCELLPDGGWSIPKNAGKTINSEWKEVFPYIDKNGTLYFSSDDIKGMGGLDIYFSKGSKDHWSKPENPGYPVNSPKDDFSVYIIKPENSGYLSSNRDGGKGKDDIYYFYLLSDKKCVLYGKTIERLSDSSLVELKNVKVNIKIQNNKNNYADSLQSDENGKFYTNIDVNKSYTLTIMKDGYFTQSKTITTKKIGKDTIYVEMITGIMDSLTKPVSDTVIKPFVEIKSNKLILLKGTIVDDISSSPIKATIELINNVKNEVIAGFESNSATGKYLVSLPSGVNYGITVKADDYLFHSENFDIPATTGYNEIVKDIRMKKIEAGNKIVLNNIFFDFDKATLRPESKSELDRLVKLLTDMPALKIEISGHTDHTDISSAAYNKTLSLNRAKAAADYLVENGIDASRLTYKGYGFDQPIATNDTEEGRQQNRRTEFKIIGINNNK